MILSRRVQNCVRAIVPSSVRPIAKRWFYRITGILYRGNRVGCVCCKGAFRSFLVRGKNRREFSCPGCGSHERHRLITLYLSEQTNFFSGGRRVLHIAPEISLQLWFQASRRLFYVAGDISGKKVIDIRLDICRLPFADQSFDFILCSHVLEHVSNDRAAMEQFVRVLDPDGFALLHVPIDGRRDTTLEYSTVESPEERRRLLAGAHGHQRAYGKDYKIRLERAGFQVELIDYAAKQTTDVLQRYGIQRRPGEELYICRRSQQHPAQCHKPAV